MLDIIINIYSYRITAFAITVYCKTTFDKENVILIFLCKQHKQVRHLNFSLCLNPKKEVGVLLLAQLKKILISLPDNLLKEVDSIVAMEKINRSEFVREAMKLYIREKRRIEMRDKLKKGYQQMAEINVKLAEICFEADNDQQQKYEESLRELEDSGN